jgi:hypothetical protein
VRQAGTFQTTSLGHTCADYLYNFPMLYVCMHAALTGGQQLHNKEMNEYERICAWIEVNVSDGSAWTFRAWAIKRHGGREEGCNFVRGELDQVQRLVLVYKGHEALWNFVQLMLLHYPSYKMEMCEFARKVLEKEYEAVDVQGVRQRGCAERLIAKCVSEECV